MMMIANGHSQYAEPRLRMTYATAPSSLGTISPSISTSRKTANTVCTPTGTMRLTTRTMLPTAGLSMYSTRPSTVSLPLSRQVARPTVSHSATVNSTPATDTATPGRMPRMP